MKTVIDAVNELEADLINLKDKCCYKPQRLILEIKVNHSEFGNKCIGDLIAGSDLFSTNHLNQVCAFAKFNDLVSQMETNFGLSVSYDTYKDVYKSICFKKPKSDKELEVMDIDNLKETKSKLFQLIQELLGYHRINDDQQEYIYEIVGRILKSCNIETKPRPKPVFTQAMADNGELPSVGMECMALVDLNWRKVEVLAKKINGAGFDVAACRVISEIGGQCGLLYWCMEFKPLTPPIELIDGGKYEFELCFGDYRLGYWKEERNSFFDSLLCVNKICGKSEASNIQPLTAEVK
tara:strand:+ start:119 stop:1000 length:882 start_codon:yes stop_codon:yes gene_type:complete